jgi:hypothetical protein
MKSLSIFILIIFVTLTNMINAQSPQYIAAMKDNVGKISKWSEAPQTLAATFERIAQAEKSQWLPYYYAAYATLIQSFGQTTLELKDQTLDRAQSLLDAATSLQPDSSECMVMQGFLYIGRLQADPMKRAAEFSQKAQKAFDRAIKLNPENPRGYYMKGVTILNTPDFYGGGKGPAKPMLILAVAKFSTFIPSSELAPNWGKEDCQKKLSSCE